MGDSTFKLNNPQQYKNWVIKIKSFLREEGVWLRVSKDEPGDELYTGKSKRSQAKIDTTATRIIYQHLSEKVIESVGDVEDPNTLWERIKDMYSADDVSERDRLRNLLFNSPGNTALERINNFDVNQARYQEIAGTLNDEDKIAWIMRILKHPLVDSLQQQLRLHTNLRKYYTILKELRFIAEKIDNNKKSSNNHYSQSSKPKKKCGRCWRTNHVTKNARLERISDKHFAPACPGKGGNKENNEANTRNVTQQGEGTQQSESFEIRTQKSYNSEEDTETVYDETADVLVEHVLNTIEKDKNKIPFIVDSGASSHVLPKRYISKAFEIKDVQDGHVNVVGGTLPITKRASFKIKTDMNKFLVLKDAIVLDTDTCLISFGKLLEKDLRIKTKDKNIVFVNEDNKIVLTAKKEANRVFKTEAEFIDNEKIFTISEVEYYHKLFGHPSVNILKNTLKLHNIKIKVPDIVSCEVCSKTKQQRTPVHKQKVFKASKPLERLYCDTVSSTVRGKAGEHYFIVVTDSFSKYRYVENFKSKDRIPENLIIFFKKVQRLSEYKIKEVYMDQGTEFKNSTLRTYFDQEGISFRFSPVYLPEANGTAERANGRILQLSRTLIYESKLEKKYWTYATKYAAFISNNISTSTVEIPPVFVLFKRKPQLNNLFIFGQKVVYRIKKPENKFAARSKKGIYVGVKNTSAEHIILDDASGKEILARDIRPLTNNLYNKYKNENENTLDPQVQFNNLRKEENTEVPEDWVRRSNRKKKPVRRYVAKQTQLTAFYLSSAKEKGKGT
eukprot:snap_masked-scaffold_90-processed-gene-0.27-mRNA-1 protein AED:1.00 eAED:1.00 QI:0/0/0/0/1/1/3/0/785